MQVDGKLPLEQRRGYSNVFSALYRIFAEEGIQAGWRGVGPTVSRAVVITVSQLGTNEEVKERLSKDYGMSGFKLVVASAVISSVVVCVASNPMDTAKVRMQQQVVDPVTGEKPYPNMAVTLMKMVSQEGLWLFGRAWVH